MYYIYMIRCEDNSIYTGITTDLERRLKEHFGKEGKGAKYTVSHTIKKVEKVWKAENRSLASKLEYSLKKLSKIEKESLIIDKCKIEDFFGKKLECEQYEEELNFKTKKQE